MKTPKNLYGFAKFFKDDGQYYFKFNSAEGRPILYSHAYPTAAKREEGIQAVIENAGEKKQYEIEKTTKGQYYFFLKFRNYKPICRSVVFDSKEETEKNMQVVMAIKKDVPIFDLVEEQKEEVRAEIREPVSEIIVPKEESAEKPTHYKFSLFYYPASDTWKIIHDRSEDSKPFNKYDGKKIEEFIMAHLTPQEKEKKKSITPKTSAKKAPEVPGIQMKEEIQLKIKKFGGGLAENFVKPFDMIGFEISPKEGHWASSPYSVKIKAKSLEKGEEQLVGELKDQTPQGGRLMVPFSVSQRLKSGMYSFLVNVKKQEEDGTVTEMIGSQLVYLN